MNIRNSLVFRLFFGIVASAALVSCATPAAKPAAGPAPTTAPVAAAPTKPPVSIPISVIIQHLADGTSVVRDVGNAYQFTLTQEWMVIPVAQEDIDRATQASPAPDAEFLRLAQSLYEKKSDAFRLIGMNTDTKFAKGASPSLVLVTAIPDEVAARLPGTELAKMIQTTVFSDANANSVQQDVVRNANGLDVAVVDGPYDYYSTQGATLQTRCRVMGFASNSRVILIQFITPNEFGAELLSRTDQIVDTIKSFRP